MEVAAAAAYKERKWTCKVCESTEHIQLLAFPYVFRYLVAELAAMNIKVALDVMDKRGTTRSLVWLSFTNSLVAFSPQFMFTGQSFRLKGILPKWGKLGRFCGLEYDFFAKSERQTDNHV